MLCTSFSSLLERDLKTIWHPFTQRGVDPLPLPFVQGKGVYLYTEEGERYIDAISSWWVNLHGHAHPAIAAAIAKQAHKLEHVIFTDYTHPPAINFAEELLEVLPPGFSKVFFSDNGSTAVEVALKMALQWWYNRGEERRVILSLKGGYHGDTFGAMSLAGKTVCNHPFWPFLFDVIHLSPPCIGEEEKRLKQLEEILSQHKVAAFIFEPLIQGAGGMRIYSREGLDALLHLCQNHDVLTIADEVMTGFGRTGPLFASSSLSHLPDFIALSKGITGGFLPLGATVTTQEIYDGFLSHKRKDAFLHGHSYTANPLACTAAEVSLSLTKKSRDQRTAIEQSHRRFCDKWKGISCLKRFEFLGTILVLEFASEEGYFASIRGELVHHFLHYHILLRPLGNVLYVMPPYCITQGELDLIYHAIEMYLEKRHETD